MKIGTGHYVTNDVKIIDAHRVTFIAEDGKSMFEVSIGSDGHSIEVRGVDACRVGGVLYVSTIDIRPRVGNCVEVRARKYGDQ